MKLSITPSTTEISRYAVRCQRVLRPLLPRHTPTKKAAFNSRLIRFLNLFKRRAIYAQIKQRNSASFARFLRVFLCISFPRPPATLHFPATRAVIGLPLKFGAIFLHPLYAYLNSPPTFRLPTALSTYSSKHHHILFIREIAIINKASALDAEA